MPSFKALSVPWQLLKKLLHAIGRVQSILVLSVIYFCFIGPFALLARLLGADLLKKQASRTTTFWSPKEEEPANLERAKQPY